LPIEFLVRWDVDEIVFLDISATAEGRRPALDVVDLISQHCLVPLTFGGGIRSVADVRDVIRAGADKVAVNTVALEDAAFVTHVADVFGSQCIVVSIDAKREDDGSYQVYGGGGHRATGLDPAGWAARVQELGAGEIFLNSIDRDGSRQGYDLDLVKRVASAVTIPVVACGGVGRPTHLAPAITVGKASAAAAGNIFHHTEHATIVAKAQLLRDGVDVRLDSQATYDRFDFDETGRLLMLSAEELAAIELRSARSAP
jgi:cyclase